MPPDLTQAALQAWLEVDRPELTATTDPFGGAAWLRAFVAQVLPAGWQGHALRGADGYPLWLGRAIPKSAVFAPPANYYTGLLDAPARAALTAAPAARAADLPVVQFSPLDADLAAQLAAAWRAAGWWVDLTPAFGNWYLPCRGLDFEAYMQGRPERLHNTWHRKRRRFERGEGGARLQIVTQPQDVAAGMDAFEAVYRASWKPPESHPGFIRAWALACADQGWLRLGIAWHGQVPVAAQFWFTTAGKAYIFKLAYDKRHAALSAGTVLSAHLFERALAVDRVAEIDYLSGDDAYKQDWVSHRRQRLQLIACNTRTAAGLQAGLRQAAGRLMRAWRG